MSCRVALVVDLESRYGVDVLRGACRIGHRLGWRLRFARHPWSHGGNDPFPQGVDGVIGYLGAESLQRLERMGIPTIDLKPYPDGPPPAVAIDEAEVGRCAARHLLDQGLTSLAAVATERERPVSHLRLAGFREVAAAAGAAYQECCPPGATSEELIRRLVPWLTALPAPTGVFGMGDYYADLVLVACQEAGLPVPERIAVIGADDDAVRCLTAPVPLSSVAIPFEELGAAAALHLQARFAGRDPGPMVVLAPGPAIARASTDGLAGLDPGLGRVAAYIRDNLAGNLAVDRLAAAAGLNRRTLERRCRSVLRRSVHDEIRRLRVQRGMELLAGSDLPVSAIAIGVGLSHNAFISAFQAVTGTAPGAWRQARRLRQPA